MDPEKHRSYVGELIRLRKLAVKEGLWQRRLLHEIMPEWSGPLPIMCDNMSSIDLVKNPKFHKKTKHIEVRYHFIRLAQEEKEIDVKHISSDE